MKFVVVDLKTWQVLKGKAYGTHSAAQRSATCANKREKKRYPDFAHAEFRRNWQVMTSHEWVKQNYQVEVNSLMGGKCMVRRSDVGTCVDPSTERYWCM